MVGSEQCPKCGHESYVAETRSSKKRPLLRRRICCFCQLRWSTHEVRYIRQKKEAQRVATK